MKTTTLLLIGLGGYALLSLLTRAMPTTPVAPGGAPDIPKQLGLPVFGHDTRDTISIRQRPTLIRMFL